MSAARTVTLLLTAAVLASCRKAPTPPPGPPVSVAGSGLTGRVTFLGAPPPERTIEVTDLEICPGGVVKDESLLVDPTGGISNVLVWVNAPPPAGDRVPSDPAILTMAKGRYEPRVLAMRSGQKLVLSNEDPVRHNPHHLSKESLSFWAGSHVAGRMPDPGESKVIGTAGRAEPPAPVKCDVHSWMRASLVVFDHPWFAITAADGTFKIPGLPDGEHEVRFWHEKLGERRLSVHVVGGSARADTQYTP